MPNIDFDFRETYEVKTFLIYKVSDHSKFSINQK